MVTMASTRGGTRGIGGAAGFPPTCSSCLFCFVSSFPAGPYTRCTWLKVEGWHGRGGRAAKANLPTVGRVGFQLRHGNPQEGGRPSRVAEDLM